MLIDTDDKTTTNWMKEAQKGYIRIGVLILLNKKPSHGYEIMKEIKNRTGGFWKPTAGGVYPTLRSLEEAKYIEGAWQTQKNRRVRVYKITESGKAILKQAIIKQSEITNNIGALFQEFAREVLKIEPETLSMPNVPSLFSVFLDEEEKTEDDIKKLEQQRLHIRDGIKMLQKNLKVIDQKIAEKKQLEPKKT